MYILNTRVSRTSYADATSQIRRWAREGLSKYVCVAPVSSIMEAYDSSEFHRILNEADLVTPDGMPVVWGLRLLGFGSASRVYGPDLTLKVLEMAASEGLSVGFHGGSRETLERLVAAMSGRFVDLGIAWACSPPFREATKEQIEADGEEINRASPSILFVGLGSPKQERWMASQKGRVQAVMIGVGAAFDFLAGTKPQAPRWVMRIGMEWFYRLLTEPRRLWKRYLKQNPKFVALFCLQLLGQKRFH